MLNIFKTERPIIAAFLGLLLFIKIISGLNVILNFNGMIPLMVGLEIIFISCVIYGINKKGGGEASLITMFVLLIVVVLLDISTAYILLNGHIFKHDFLPALLGSELTYVITAFYIFFSKKLRRFKSNL